MKSYKQWMVFWLALFLIAGPAPSGASAQAARGAGVSADELPKALKGLDIKSTFIPSPFPKAGVIGAMKGHVVVLHRAKQEAYFAAEGDPVYENDSFYTLARSRCRIVLNTHEVVNMGDHSDFTIEKFLDQKQERKQDSLFSMIQGKVRIYALRLFGYKEKKMALRTPTAVVGVRGTKFGVHVYRAGEGKRTQRVIHIADSGKPFGLYLDLAQAALDGKTLTDAHCEDGLLEVETEKGKKEVGPGEMYKQETDEVMPTPPGYAEQFRKDTDPGTDGGKPADEDTSTETGMPGTGTGEPDQKIISDIIMDQADQAQREVGRQIESLGPSVPETPINDSYDIGYDGY